MFSEGHFLRVVKSCHCVVGVNMICMQQEKGSNYFGSLLNSLLLTIYLLALYHTIPSFNDQKKRAFENNLGKEVFSKQSGKRGLLKTIWEKRPFENNPGK